MRGQQQYVAVTKERKRVGFFGMSVHAVLTVATLGLWLLIGPVVHWLWHLVGPKKKVVTREYGTRG